MSEHTQWKPDLPIITIDTSNISPCASAENSNFNENELSDRSYDDDSSSRYNHQMHALSFPHFSDSSWDQSTITPCSIQKPVELYPFREATLKTLAKAALNIKQPFAFTAKQLQLFVNPRNIDILRMIGGIEGLCLSLHTSPVMGLSVDEKYIADYVSLKDLMTVNDYLIYEKMCKEYGTDSSRLRHINGRNREFLFLEEKSFSIFSNISLPNKDSSSRRNFISTYFKRFLSYICFIFTIITKAMCFISNAMLKLRFIRILKKIFIGESESYKDFMAYYGDSFKTRISVFGINRSPRRRSKGVILLFLRVFRDPILILLLCATVISFAIDIYHQVILNYSYVDVDGSEYSGVDGIAILVAIFVVAIVTSINDYQKELQFEKLNSKKKDYDIRVIRSGKPFVISVYELQVGDILLFQLGDLLPADGILIDGYNVCCDESNMTGESDAVEKTPCSVCLSNTPPNVMFDERYDPFLISGSKIIEGTGKCIIICVGINSYYEKIMASLQTESDDTPLQMKLARFSSSIAKFGISITLLLFNILFCFYLFQFADYNVSVYEKTSEFMRILIVSITVIVVAIPEGLPLAITLVLAFATKKMSKENNLVRHLKSCETMGSVTTICSDKTGTLTQNKMTLVLGTIGLSVQFQDYSNLEMDQKDVTNKIVLLGISDLSESLNPHIKQLILGSIVFNSSAHLTINQQGQNVFIGSKTDCALLEFAQKYLGMDDFNTERSNADILQIVPFNSSRKYMGSIVSLPNGGARLYIKGASETLLEYSSYIIHDPLSKDINCLSTVPLKQEDKDLIYKKIVEFASLSLRTIALVYKDFDTWPVADSQTLLTDFHLNFNNIFSEMTFIGVFSIMDPLREGVKDVIQICKNAGITVRMVTGDNKITASAIAKSCGIYMPGDILMEGIDFRNLSSEDMNRIVPRLVVLARSSPEDKEILVSKLKELGEVVAVTGDGTNDGPALKKADVGFSMGISGTEVAKEASDIILMDDNFASIIVACAWGRCINLAIRKFLLFLMTVNLTAVSLVFITSMTDPRRRSSLTPVQLLWINLIMDTFAALALATDPPHSNILNTKPEPRSSPLITFQMWKLIIGQSIYQITITLILHFFGSDIFRYYQKDRFSSDSLPTLIFNTFVFMQIFNEFNCWRLGNNMNIFDGLKANPWYIIINFIMLTGQILIIFVGGDAFHVKRLNLEQWAISIFLGSLCVPIFLLIKQIPDKYLISLFPFFKKKHLNPNDNTDINQSPWNLASLQIKDELAFLKTLKNKYSVDYLWRTQKMNTFYEKLSQSMDIELQNKDKIKQLISKQNHGPQSFSVLGAATIAPAIMAGSIGGCISSNVFQHDIDDSLRDRGVEVYIDKLE